LYCYLINNNILVNGQFGFTDKLSTDTATFTYLNEVLSSLDKKICSWFILWLAKTIRLCKPWHSLS